MDGHNLNDSVSASVTTNDSYLKKTTRINKANTVDATLTLADAWCVKYEKTYTYNGLTDSPETKSKDGPHVSEDEESNDRITNSNLSNKIKNKAKSKGNAWLSENGINGSVQSVDLYNEEEKIKCVTTEETTTVTQTKNSSYTADPGKENYTSDETGKQKFVDILNQHTEVRSLLLKANVQRKLFEILESNEKTVNMVDLTKYLLYKATGIKIDEVDSFDFSTYNPGSFTGIGGTLEGNTTEERVWLALINAGFNDVTAAAAMGNLSYESGGSGTKTIKTDTVEVGYTEENGGIGMCQWTNNGREPQGRNTQLRKYAQSKQKTWKDEETQIEFLITEITGKGKAQGYASYQFITKTYDGVTYSSDALKKVGNNQSNIEFATKAFAATFERPLESAFISSMPKRIELAKYFYSKFNGKRSSTSTFGPSSQYANKSAEEKAKYLYPNGIPTTKEQAESYLTTIDVPITQKNGTKSTASIRLHKAIAQDVYNACLAAQNAGFKIYEIGSYRAFGTDSAGATGGLSYSQHCYGLAVDINVNENCYIGSGGAVSSGSFWKPNENEYSISPDGVLVRTFKSMGWGWGGDWTSTKDYMHFSFMGS